MNKEKLFNRLNFSVSELKTGLIGDNGTGKSTLLNILASKTRPDEGTVSSEGNIVLFPQDFSDYNDKSISEVLSVKEKLASLERIVNGKSSDEDYIILNDDWDINERIKQVFLDAKLENFNLERKFETLSGGEKSRLLFASLLLNKPDFALLDEPTNHLDSESRNILYSMIKNYKKGLVIVSHDRELLNLMEEISELSSKGIRSYGGNYDFYKEQKKIETEALLEAFTSAQQMFNKAVKEKNRTIEKQLSRTSKGEKRNISRGMVKVQRDYLENRSMKTLSRLKNTHNQKTESLKNKLLEAKEKLDAGNSINIDMNASDVHSGKIILEAKDVNFKFEATHDFLWKEKINFTITGSERWSIAGVNGAGKSVLLKLILGKLNPSTGEINLHTKKVAFLDQDVDILNNELTIFENLKEYSEKYSENKIPEHELRIKLARFLFRGEEAFKKIKELSGGEKMRAGLACILASGSLPELLILDEPANNLDIKSIEELTETLSQYKGAVLVVSHDKKFLHDIRIEKQLNISRTEKNKLLIY